MNLPIRSEAPPLDLPVQPTPTPDKASKPAGAGDFADVLSQELGQTETGESAETPDHKQEPAAEKKEASKVTTDAWSLFGIAPATFQIIQPIGSSLPTESPDSQRGVVPQETTQVTGAPAPASGAIEGETKTAATPAVDEKRIVTDKTVPELVSRPEKASNQQKIPEYSPSPPVNSEENAPKSAKEALKASGILVAQEQSMLRPSPKQDEIAASGKGDAPARNDLSIPEPGQQEIRQAAAELRKVSAVNEALSQKRDEQPIKVNFSPAETFSIQKHHADSVASSELTPTHTSSVETVIETIHNHVQFLRYTGNDRLELVFRPDKDTQLFIQVARVNGEIQVQARWERGELAQLSAHWNQVQQSLASQGIRVEPLGQSSNLSSQVGSGSSGQKQQQGKDDSTTRPMPLDSLVPLQSKSNKGKASSSRKSGGGWQSWA